MSTTIVSALGKPGVEDPYEILSERIAVACHDAGGANLIIGWLRRMPKLQVKPHLGGPAIALWQKAFPNAKNLPLDEALAQSTRLLSGTGWGSSLEHEARAAARKRGIPSIAVLDHWVNYAERFERNGETVYPGELWVTDKYALALASALGGESRVRLMPNAYLEEQVAEIRELDATQREPSPKNVLYALEPIRRRWKSDETEPGEFQALNYFCANLSSLGLSDDASIRLRPHPSDPPGKYDAWCARHRERDIRLAADEPLSAAISRAAWVVGCESFVLVVGLAAGRRVASTLPPWAPKSLLPHADIVRLRDLNERNR